ncbi:MAG: NusG domain II-containing protein [Clostridia bacterium]|nr:NusG domain II-containing protein [Clostridia bacterium]
MTAKIKCYIIIGKGGIITERKLFHKKDIVVLALLLCLALLFYFTATREKGERAEIWINGDLYKSFELKEPFEIKLDNGATIKGDGESAYFEHSDCPDKVCVNTGRLSVSGEWAACLPNETVLKISKGNGDVDTVS